MRAGKLDRSITIERQTETVQPSGAVASTTSSPSKAWTTRPPAPAIARAAAAHDSASSRSTA